MISSCLADRLLFSVAQVKQLQLPVMVEPVLFFLKCHEVKLGIKVESWNKRWPCWTLKLADRPFCLILSVVEVTLVLESPQEACGLKHALKRSTSIIQPQMLNRYQLNYSTQNSLRPDLQQQAGCCAGNSSYLSYGFCRLAKTCTSTTPKNKQQNSRVLWATQIGRSTQQNPQQQI